MFTKMNLMQENLRTLMEKNGDDAYSLEEKSGVPQPTTQRFLSGKHGDPRSSTVKKWAAAYGISESQLRGDVSINLEALQKQAEYSSDAVSIPLLAATASMGNGADNTDADMVVDVLRVTKQWVTKTFPGVSALANLRFIHAIGDSMHPTFNDGDILLVDTGVLSATVDGVYVLDAHERLYIKRVRRRLDGVYEISSDNPSVKTVDTLNGGNEVLIKGRVVWVWNGRRV